MDINVHYELCPCLLSFCSYKLCQSWFSSHSGFDCFWQLSYHLYENMRKEFMFLFVFCLINCVIVNKGCSMYVQWVLIQNADSVKL
uniref:Uncharacterized protein n=1 Tax=Manihot esculenta TaxID=3983 RepID=A0A2C9WIX7_MANES